jgi:hypothetical protein
MPALANTTIPTSVNRVWIHVKAYVNLKWQLANTYLLAKTCREKHSKDHELQRLTVVTHSVRITYNSRCRHDVHQSIAESLDVCWLQKLGTTMLSPRDPTFCIPLLLTLHCCRAFRVEWL